MILDFIKTFSGKGKLIVGGLAIITIVGLIGYGVMKIQILNSNLENREQEIEQLTEETETLNRRYDSLEQDFNDFALKVNRDLERQRSINAEIREVNNEYKQRVTELEDSFNFDEDGNPRDWEEIFNEQADALEEIVNERTRGIRDEFDEITRD